MNLLNRHALAAALLAALVFAIYYPSLSGPFQLDDAKTFLTDAKLLSDLSLNSLLTLAGNESSGMLGRPLSILSLGISTYIWEQSPFWMKAENVALHAINAFLVYLLIMRICLLLCPKYTNVRLIALWIAVTWALHPLLVSSVSYVVQRMNLLATFFMLLYLLHHLYMRANISAFTHARVTAGFAFSITLLLAGAFCKENAVLALPIACAFEWVLASNKSASNLSDEPPPKFFLWLYCIGPMLLGIAYFAYKFPMLAGYTDRDFTAYERVLSETHILLFYLRQILLPRLQDMTLFLDTFDVIRAFDLATVIASSCLLLLASSAVFLRKKSPLYALGIMIFFIAHFMESTFIGLELAFEHRNYVPTIGILLAICGLYRAAHHYIESENVRKSAAIIACIIPITFAGLTHVRATDWSSESRLVNRTYTNHPESPRAIIGMANFLVKNNRPDQAEILLDQLAEIDTQDAGPAVAILLMDCRLPAMSEAKIERATRRLISGKPTTYAADALDKLTKVVGNNNCETLREYILELTSAAIANIHLPNLKKQGQGMFLWAHARALVISGQAQASLQYYDEAYKRSAVLINALLEKTFVIIQTVDTATAREAIATLASRSAKARHPLLPGQIKSLQVTFEQIHGQPF